MSAAVDEADRHIRAWLETFVVGLNLCPFARPFLGAQSLRIVVCDQTSTAALRRAFLTELDMLQGSGEDEIATTLLAFPLALADFEGYLEFLEEAQYLLGEAGLEGVIQLASFHPQYQFEGEPEGAASHYSNRAPYPIIHLLREDMLSRVLADSANPEEIPMRNIETLDGIGIEELARRWRDLFGA